MDLGHDPRCEEWRRAQLRDALERRDDAANLIELATAIRTAFDVRLERRYAKADLSVEQEVDFIRKEVSLLHEKAYDR